MNLTTYRLYVGSNNDTHELEIKKIKAVVTSLVDGFTVQEAVGLWHGAEESTAIITIATNKEEQINQIVTTLKEELTQDAIMCERTGAAVFL